MPDVQPGSYLVFEPDGRPRLLVIVHEDRSHEVHRLEPVAPSRDGRYQDVPVGALQHMLSGTVRVYGLEP